jgi:hypothetical protein
VAVEGEILPSAAAEAAEGEILPWGELPAEEAVPEKEAISN